MKAASVKRQWLNRLCTQDGRVLLSWKDWQKCRICSTKTPGKPNSEWSLSSIRMCFEYITTFSLFLTFQKRKIGPGSYNIKDFLEASDEKPRSIRGIVDTRDKRFSPPYVSDSGLLFKRLSLFSLLYVSDVKFS